MSLADREYQRHHRMDEAPHKPTSRSGKLWFLVLFLLALLAAGLWWVYR